MLPKQGEHYRHFKGNTYEILAIARENDLQVDFVVHKGLHDGRIWTRTVANFLGDKDGAPRFRKINATPPELDDAGCCGAAVQNRCSDCPERRSRWVRKN